MNAVLQPALTPPPFQAIADLVRQHATARPAQRALVQGERTVTWRQLDAMVDRVAASLQRDGVMPQQRIAICAANSLEYAAVFLGALRAGAAVAPLPTGSLPSQLATMVVDSGAGHLFVDGAAPAFDTAARRIYLDGAAQPALQDWLAAPGSASAPGHGPARLAVQHHLFLGHHRHAEGNHPAARNALGACGAGRGLRLRSRHRDAARHLAVLQHHAGVFLPHHRPWRLRRAGTAQIRCRDLPGHRRERARHPHHAGAGAVPAHHGPAAVRPVRPVRPSA